MNGVFSSQGMLLWVNAYEGIGVPAITVTALAGSSDTGLNGTNTCRKSLQVWDALLQLY